MADHIFQHPDPPTWCVNCGRFDVYCDRECNGPATRSFDSSVPENQHRMYEECFGAAEPERVESV